MSDDLSQGFDKWFPWLLSRTSSDGGGWHQKAAETMIDNEANPPGIKHEFRVWCVKHQKKGNATARLNTWRREHGILLAITGARSRSWRK